MADAVQRLSHALAGRYAIDHALGQGGMATVYLAHDLRHVGAERFVVEIRTTARLRI